MANFTIDDVYAMLAELDANFSARKGNKELYTLAEKWYENLSKRKISSDILMKASDIAMERYQYFPTLFYFLKALEEAEVHNENKTYAPLPPSDNEFPDDNKKKYSEPPTIPTYKTPEEILGDNYDLYKRHFNLWQKDYKVDAQFSNEEIETVKECNRALFNHGFRALYIRDGRLVFSQIRGRHVNPSKRPAAKSWSGIKEKLGID